MSHGASDRQDRGQMAGVVLCGTKHRERGNACPSCLKSRHCVAASVVR
jgi:hypothetical protein